MLGTLVRDTIHRPGSSGPVHEWGGIAYSLSAFEAAGPPGWEVVPLIKVGRDVREEADRLLGRYRRMATLEGVREVPEPNNRVELLYTDGSRRRERLRGGVPGWEWPELEPLVERCDAVYVNFIAGWELALPAARRLREGFGGPLYADLHSLLLEVGPDGVRRPRPIEGGRGWMRCFDYVQMNREELATLAAGSGLEPWPFAASAVGEATRAVFVTLGRDGAAWVASGDVRSGAAGAEPASSRLPDGSTAGRGVRTGGRAPERRVRDGDPTGCGDVWGITCFGALLEGEGPASAVERANEVAARNARAVGGTGLLA